MKRARILALVASLSVATLGPWVSAAPPATGTKASPADAALAYKHLAAGQKLLAAKKYAEARAELELSFGLDPEPITLKGIADALRGEARGVDAYEAYQRALEQPGRPLLSYQRKEVETALADLAQKTATLAITVNEDGAAIALDGVAVGTSPRPAPIRLELGAHKVTISKTGFTPFETTVTLVGGQAAAVSATLSAVAKPTNTVELVVKERSGRQFDVVVDGLIVGKTPWRGSFAAGSYQIALADAGVSSAPSPVTVTEGVALPELVLEGPAPVSTAPEPECAGDDDCDAREQCLSGMCKKRPKKPKFAEEGQACNELPCAGDGALVCDENVCRKRADLPYTLHRELGVSWKVGAGLGGDSKWFVPIHALTINAGTPIGKHVRYRYFLGLAFENGFTGFNTSALNFGFPIPIGPQDPHDLQLLVEPGFDAFRIYGFPNSSALDFVFSYAVWGRVTVIRRGLFAFVTPIELERPWFRLAGNSKTAWVFGASGTNYMFSLGVGVVL